MKSHLCIRSLPVLFILLSLVGCTNPPAPPPKSTITSTVTQTKSDAFRSVLETVRYPDNPRGSDDWTRFRDASQLLSGHFSKPEVMERMRLTSEERKFLESTVHLTDDEMVEVEANSFRTADAHYLDECFLLRDAARSLEMQGLDQIDQALVHFRWVMRNVELLEVGDTWIPPAFVLRRGFGNALERSLVFLALLRQSQIEGSMIVVPESEPRQFLVAVLNEKTADLHLFDPRLGLALPGKDAKKIATLKEAMENPQLLEPSLIPPGEAKKLQAWLVCPLYALAPRMLELQKGLSAHDVVTLYLHPSQLFKDIASASKLTVKVWNAPAQAGKLPDSPTRVLRMFLPRHEGGLNETNRVAELVRNRLPLDRTSLNYTQINLHPELMPERAYQRLNGITADLFNKYDVQIREMFLRGRYESVLRRQERLQSFARNDALTGLADDAGFRETLAQWREYVRLAEADALLQSNNPNVSEQAVRKAQSLWYSDQFVFGWLLNLDNEKKGNRELDNENKQRNYEKSTLSGILAVGVRDYFDLQLARSQAEISHEKAARAQARLLAMAKPTKSGQTKAHEAWSIAKTAWGNNYLDRIALDFTIKQRLEQIQGRVRPTDAATKISLLEHLHQDVHRYFAGKLQLAACLEHLQGEQAASVVRERTLAEIADLEKQGLLQAEIKLQRVSLGRLSMPEQLRQGWLKRLDLLAGDWSATGALFWMKRHLEQQIIRKNT